MYNSYYQAIRHYITATRNTLNPVGGGGDVDGCGAVGAAIHHLPRILLLPAALHLAQDGGRLDEALQEGHHRKVGMNIK